MPSASKGQGSWPCWRGLNKLVEEVVGCAGRLLEFPRRANRTFGTSAWGTMKQPSHLRMQLNQWPEVTRDAGKASLDSAGLLRAPVEGRGLLHCRGLFSRCVGYGNHLPFELLLCRSWFCDCLNCPFLLYGLRPVSMQTSLLDCAAADASAAEAPNQQSHQHISQNQGTPFIPQIE